MVARAVSTITQHYYALNKLIKCVVGAVRGQDFMARACFAPVELRSWQVLFPGDHSQPFRHQQAGKTKNNVVKKCSCGKWAGSGSAEQARMKPGDRIAELIFWTRPMAGLLFFGCGTRKLGVTFTSLGFFNKQKLSYLCRVRECGGKGKHCQAGLRCLTVTHDLLRGCRGGPKLNIALCQCKKSKTWSSCPAVHCYWHSSSF